MPSKKTALGDDKVRGFVEFSEIERDCGIENFRSKVAPGEWLRTSCISHVRNALGGVPSDDACVEKWLDEWLAMPKGTPPVSP